MRLFVGGLSYDTTEEDLQGHFAGALDVEVVEAVIIKDREREGEPSKGFGFVTIDTTRKEQDVIGEFHMSRLDGRNITVNQAKPRGPREPRARERKII